MIINQTYSGGGIELSLVISVASGSVVTATKGGKSVTGVSVDGVCVLTVPEAGTWTVSATLGGKTTPAQTVTVKSQWEAALEYGTPLGELAVGSSVFTNVNGARTEFLVVQQGKPSSIYDDSCNGVWLLMKDVYEERQWHSSNVNDYANSTIHSDLNSTFLAMFDSNIQKAIKQVKLPYRAGSGYGKTVTSGANGLSAKIFLLSSTEVNLVPGYEPTNEGACLSYFSGTTQNESDTKRVAYLNGSAADWWLRSPYCDSSGGSQFALLVKSDGYRNYRFCSYSFGIRPALVLPSTLLVSDDGTISA